MKRPCQLYNQSMISGRTVRIWSLRRLTVISYLAIANVSLSSSLTSRAYTQMRPIQSGRTARMQHHLRCSRSASFTTYSFGHSLQPRTEHQVLVLRVHLQVMRRDRRRIAATAEPRSTRTAAVHRHTCSYSGALVVEYGGSGIVCWSLGGAVQHV